MKLDINKIGIYILTINLILCGLIYTSQINSIVTIIVCFVSSLIALTFDVYAIIKSDKKIFNIIFTLLNGILIGVLIYYFIIIFI